MSNVEQRTKADGATVYRVKVRLKGHPTQSATLKRKTDAKIWIQNTEFVIREG